jgi:hypothetical protein
MNDALSNFQSVEEQCFGNHTVTFTSKSRQVMLHNDDTSLSLRFRFNKNQAWGTLFPGESVSVALYESKIYMQCNGNCSFRLWVFG